MDTVAITGGYNKAVKNWIMTGLMIAAFVAITLPLLLILYSLVSRGGAVVAKSFPDFFTATIPVVSRRAGPGMGPAIIGTLLCTGGATLIAVPLGILGAIYLLPARNVTAWQVLGLFWLVQQAAKLNVFLGVPNAGVRFLPPKLVFLTAFFGAMTGGAGSLGTA